MKDATARPKSQGSALALTVLVYLLMLWFVASLFRTGGYMVFLVGSACLCGGLFAFWHRQRRVLYTLFLVAVLASVTILVVEAALRVAPYRLKGMAGNYAYGRYHAGAGGIYDFDLHQGKKLRPNVTCTICFNGYVFVHDANRSGYRGPDVGRAQAVFLGDSMIYGQGVRTDQTVSANYGARTGRSVANLGIQGTGLIQSWLQLKRIGLELKPDIVFVCAHPNDLGDVTQFYDFEEVRRFLAGGVRGEREPIARARYRPAPPWHPRELWDHHLALPLYAAGLVRLLGQIARPGFDAAAPVAATVDRLVNSSANEWKVPSEGEEQLRWQAHCLALAKIQDLCKQHGARLVVFDLGFPRGFSLAMEAEAHLLGASYVPAGRVALARALAGDDIYLPDDGHWSPHGCEVVANELVAEKGNADLFVTRLP
jgi:hypothetical protein